MGGVRPLQGPTEYYSAEGCSSGTDPEWHWPELSRRMVPLPAPGAGGLERDRCWPGAVPALATPAFLRPKPPPSLHLPMKTSHLLLLGPLTATMGSYQLYLKIVSLVNLCHHFSQHLNHLLCRPTAIASCLLPDSDLSCSWSHLKWFLCSIFNHMGKCLGKSIRWKVRCKTAYRMI